MSHQTVTRQREMLAEASDVFAVVTDPSRLPEWAAPFVDRMDMSEGKWTATKGCESFAMTIKACEDARTVDYLRTMPSGRSGGAYIRVMDTPQRGCVVVMTIPLGPDADEERAVATLDGELAELAKLAGRAG